MPRSSTAALMAATVFALVPFAALAQGQTPSLPASAGKEAVEAVCTGCHQTSMINQSSGYTRAGWNELIGTMIDLSRSPEVHDSIIQYLATHFPPSTRRAPKLVPGNIEITFKEWQMPTLGQRARDPVQAEDGSIWWAGQFGNLIGRLDPATGEMREYPLPPSAMPHTVELDPKGIPWYTGNKNGSVGKVDPTTGKVTVYKMPDPNAKDPHTLVFDKKGIAWFTLQNSNMVGRLDPETGDIKLITLPTAGSKPYGIKIDAEGSPWFSCNGRALPLQDRPGHDGAHGDQAPFGGDDGPASRHRRRRHDLVRELGQGPSRAAQSEDRRNQGVAVAERAEVASLCHRVVDGVVWYNKSGMRPDALVRFDPKTETFQSWPIPSGGIYSGVLGHGRVTREGNLLIHQSATDRIIQVTPKRQAAAR